MATERRLAPALGALLLALGCASPVVAPVEPPSGALFAYYTAPLETNFEGTPAGSKVGYAQLHFIREPFSGYRVPVVTLAGAGLRLGLGGETGAEASSGRSAVVETGGLKRSRT